MHTSIIHLLTCKHYNSKHYNTITPYCLILKPVLHFFTDLTRQCDCNRVTSGGKNLQPFFFLWNTNSNAILRALTEMIMNNKQKGMVHLKIKICWNCTHNLYILGIQDLDEFVSLSEQIWRSLALHLLTNGSSAVNGCHQNESRNSW